MDITVTATEAKLKFGEILGKCIYGHNRIVIQKHGKNVAVLKPAEDDEFVPSKSPPKKWHPVVERIRKTREKIRRRQKRLGIGPGPSAVELIRQIRDEEEGTHHESMGKKK